jgi:hypothetical protein
MKTAKQAAPCAWRTGGPVRGGTRCYRGVAIRWSARYGPGPIGRITQW